MKFEKLATKRQSAIVNNVIILNDIIDLKQKNLQNKKYNSMIDCNNKQPNERQAISRNSINNKSLNKNKEIELAPLKHLSLHNTASQLQNNQKKVDTYDEIFQQINDIRDKKQIRAAILKLDCQKQRQLLIDKILNKRQLLFEQEENEKLQLVVPLINKFVKKIGRKFLNKFTSDSLKELPQKDEKEQLDIQKVEEEQQLNQEGQTTDDQKHFQKIIHEQAGNLNLFMKAMKKMGGPSSAEINANENNENQQKGGIANRKISNNQTKIKQKAFSYESIREKSKKLLEIGKMNQKQKIFELLNVDQMKSVTTHFKNSSIRMSIIDKSQNPCNENDTNNNAKAYQQQLQLKQNHFNKTRGLKYEKDIYDQVINEVFEYHQKKETPGASNFFISERGLDFRMIEKKALEQVQNQFYTNQLFKIKQKKIKSVNKSEHLKSKESDKSKDSFDDGSVEKDPVKEHLVIDEIYVDDADDKKNDSFASYTEIKLGKLYKTTRGVKEQLRDFEDLEKHISTKDKRAADELFNRQRIKCNSVLSKASSDIMETIQSKIGNVQKDKKQN